MKTTLIINHLDIHNTANFHNFHAFPLFPTFSSGKFQSMSRPLGGMRCPKGIETFPNFPKSFIFPLHPTHPLHPEFSEISDIPLAFVVRVKM